MVKGTPFDALLLPLGMLAVLGSAVFGLSIARFRRDLAPAARRHGRRPAEDTGEDQAAPIRTGAK
jgi:ABC-2 type transport system permease protein